MPLTEYPRCGTSGNRKVPTIAQSGAHLKVDTARPPPGCVQSKPDSPLRSHLWIWERSLRSTEVDSLAPQFEPLRDAAWILGVSPIAHDAVACEYCLVLGQA